MASVTNEKEKAAPQARVKSEHLDHVSSSVSPGAVSRIALGDSKLDSNDTVVQSKQNKMPIKTEDLEDKVFETPPPSKVSDRKISESSALTDSENESPNKSQTDTRSGESKPPSASDTDSYTQCDTISGTEAGSDAGQGRQKDVDEKSDGGGSTSSDTVSSTQTASVAGKVCVVCNDKALSCNFGAITCESCKAFFRRNAHKVSWGVPYQYILFCFI